MSNLGEAPYESAKEGGEGGGGVEQLFRVLPHYTTKERPCHVYSDQ